MSLDLNFAMNTFIIFVAELRLVMESAALPLLLRLVHLLERDALRVVVLVPVVHLRALMCDWDIFCLIPTFQLTGWEVSRCSLDRTCIEAFF